MRLVNATISTCGTYRYHLSRDVDAIPSLLGYRHQRIVFVMLNPSTADAERDDPTIRKCRAYAHREHAATFDVVNLYALRATDPAMLLAATDPVGPLNDQWIADTVTGAGMVIAAWGAFPYERMPRGRDRAGTVLDIIRECGAPLYTLHRTQAGFPGHPLYLPAQAPLVEL